MLTAGLMGRRATRCGRSIEFLPGVGQVLAGRKHGRRNGAWHPQATIAFCAGWLVASLGHLQAADPPDFEQASARLLIRYCIECHNGSDPRGGLDLTHREGALAGGDSGPALDAADPAASLLVERLRAGEMPPEGKHARPSPDEIESFGRWIAAGASWPAERVLRADEMTTDRRAGRDWWSLQPIARPQPPAVDDEAWCRGAIDRFVLARLGEHDLRPRAETDRVALIRRVTFDLIGLPPTPDEVADFVADPRCDAYERVVDRLL
ncbi:MAG: DUF1549 domain-containing protein, partial [Pirellulales bacterium]|nr:DUF1549 domain-containing protein [Pirellulales bacterium]